MPPETRFVPRFAAEPPQEGLPYGRWAETLRQELLSACLGLDADGEDIGDPGEVEWYPDRTYAGRTYVPATIPTAGGYEIFGFVSFVEGDGGAPDDFAAHVDVTSETAERNPDWALDLSDEVIGRWRGEDGKTAEVTLVWGRPMKAGGAVVTAELASLAVDQCSLLEERFTLVAPDAYRGDFLDVKLFDSRNRELASESLYVDDGDEEPGEASASPEAPAA